MGLITEKVEVKIASSNYKHYQEKGYSILRKENGRLDFSQTITVPVSDLPEKSGVKVDVICDECKQLKKINYGDYLRCNHNGKIYCQKCACAVLLSGENNYQWNPSKTATDRTFGRREVDYKLFVKSCLTRDNYTCQCCGKKSDRKMAVHHINSFDWCEEGRTDIKNGITLCGNCHKNFHLIYGYGNNTKEQFEEWFGKSVDYLQEYSGELPVSRKIYDYEEKCIYNSVEEYSKKHNCSVSPIRHCCNHTVTPKQHKRQDGTVLNSYSRISTVKSHHLFWLDEYEKMSQEDINIYFKSIKHKTWKPVICLNNGLQFDNCKIAADYFSIKRQYVYNYCTHKSDYGNILPDGTKLKWMYLSDFEKLSKEEREKILDVKESEA